MNIIVKFLNGNAYWQAKVLKSAEQASQILSDHFFLAKVRAVPKFDFTSDTPAQVGDKLEAAGDVVINVSFYRKWPALAIASETPGQVSFNVCKEKQGAGNPENVTHETMHAMGWSHDGNSPRGNENTVPWLVGKMVGAEVGNAARASLLKILAGMTILSALAFTAGFLLVSQADAMGKRHTLTIRAGCPACVCDEAGKCTCSQDPCGPPRLAKKTLFPKVGR